MFSRTLTHTAKTPRTYTHTVGSLIHRQTNFSMHSHIYTITTTSCSLMLWMLFRVLFGFAGVFSCLG
jgi:hypothetical protein